MYEVDLRELPEVYVRPPHPIPYQGSKRRLAGLILTLFPDRVERLVEPFAGSGAVSLAAAASSKAAAYWLNDSNAALAELWRAILERPDDLADGYDRVWTAQIGRETEHFYDVRDEFNEHNRPDLFLFLLTRAVKAAVRYNARGEFNQSPDKRRMGTRPETMRRQIRDAHVLMAGRTTVSALDYEQVLAAWRPGDLVYMDPPYQGVCTGRDDRYISGIEFESFMDALRALNRAGADYVLSYDGRTGRKTHGVELPPDLNLMQLEVNAGRSSQATLLGRDDETIESIYVSPSLSNLASARVNELDNLVHVATLF